MDEKNITDNEVTKIGSIIRPYKNTFKKGGMTPVMDSTLIKK